MSKQSIRILLYVQLILVDFTAIALGSSLSSHYLGFPFMSPLGIEFSAALLPLYALMALNNGGYSMDVLRSNTESIRRSVTAFFFTMLLMLLAAFLMHAQITPRRVPFVLNLFASSFFLGVGRLLFRYHADRQCQGSLVDELLIVDNEQYDGPLLRYTINARAEQITPDLRDPEMIARVAHYLNGFDRVIVCCPDERQNAWALLLKGANVQGEVVVERAFSLDPIGINRFGTRDTMIVSRGPLNLANRVKKRALDLAITVPVLIALLIPFGIIAALIKLDTKGPVLFRQQRVGRGNRMFAIMKFRSMRVDMTDHSGNRSASRDDDRITRIGRFIRATSIDELPQLFNVLLGDMSLVGPRPHALGSLAGNRRFWDVDEQYWVRHALKPGITGLAQIRGFRGATHHQEDLENRLRADLEYLNGWRLWRDVSILAATVKVINHHNAY